MHEKWQAATYAPLGHHGSPITRRGYMRTRPIRGGYLYPFQIALHLGYRAHTASGLILRRRLSWGPLWLKKGLVVPKVFTSKKLHLRFPREMDFGLLHGSNPKPYVPLSRMVRVAYGSVASRKSLGVNFPPEKTRHGKSTPKGAQATTGGNFTATRNQVRVVNVNRFPARFNH